jgi:hypothetical protein
MQGVQGEYDRELPQEYLQTERMRTSTSYNLVKNHFPEGDTKRNK